MKVCSKCEEQKSLSLYPKKTGTADGLAGHCKKCNAEASKAWRTNNQNNYVEGYKKYTAKNKNNINNSAVIWRASNKEKVSANNKKWNAMNKSARCKHSTEFKHKKTNRVPPWAGDELDVLVKEEAYKKARSMTNSTGVQHEVDHIVPLRGDTVSGLHVWNNLQVITKSENAMKKNHFVSTEVFA